MERASVRFAAADGRCNALSRTQTTPKQHPNNTETSPNRRPNNTQTTPKQHANNTQSTPKQHPNNTNQHTPGGTNIGFVCVQGCIY
eukprot:11225162-Lingulodinium_polyedra.AAC.1